MGSSPSKNQSPDEHGGGNVPGATESNTEGGKRKNTEEHPKVGKRQSAEEYPKTQTGSVSEQQTSTPRDESANREETDTRKQKEEEEIQREHEQLRKERIRELKKLMNQTMENMMKWKKERVGSHVQVINMSRTLQQFCIRNQLLQELELVVQIDPGILTRLREKRTEKAKLLHKLSEIAGTRLKHNNPNLADLSDQNRPTKLVDRLSQLYDDIWTDIFEKVRDKVRENVDDKVIILNLRDILRKCYEECKQIASIQRQSLYQKLAGPSTNSEDPSLLAQVNDFQKKTVEHSLKTLNTKLKQLVRESKINPTCQVLKANDPDYIKYVEGCTDLVWHTQIQSPPLVFEFESKNKDLYRKFTSAGQIIDYIVWPAVFLHEGGPLLTKGIAQFVKAGNADESVRTQVFQLENESQGQMQKSAGVTSSDNTSSDSNLIGKGVHVPEKQEKEKIYQFDENRRYEDVEDRRKEEMALGQAGTNKPAANRFGNNVPVGTNVKRGKNVKSKN